MMLARVVGTVVCTVKSEALEGRKLLVIQPLAKTGEPRGRPFVAVDAIGAGFHEMVYWCRGREASLAFGATEVPTDASIVGIVDEITPDQKQVAEPEPAKKNGKDARGRR